MNVSYVYHYSAVFVEEEGRYAHGVSETSSPIDSGDRYEQFVEQLQKECGGKLHITNFAFLHERQYDHA